LSNAGDTRDPLNGLRVLEVATFYAAPQIGELLADLGADVVKIEPPNGDPMRHMGVMRDGVSRSWLWVGRHKRSIALDLGAPDGQQTFRGLVGSADVLIENLDAKTRERWHCTYDELSQANARLVHVSVSCYGASGPYAERPGAGTLAEAFGGFTHMTGERDGPPMLASLPLGDTITAFWGVMGALAACWGRDAGSDAGSVAGQGRLVDVAMYEPVLQILGGTINAFDVGTEPPIRSGSRVYGGVPRNVYRTRDDQWLALSSTTDSQISRLLPLIGADADEDRAKFDHAPIRLQHADELDQRVAGWIAGRDRDEALAAFLDARIPAAPVNDVADLFADPHLRVRGDLERLRATDAPTLDGDRDDILRDWLGSE
jgi:crotonobetainyl-CoA:carnitine CoA-transferase CaiB-like acyl-CoA transferase